MTVRAPGDDPSNQFASADYSIPAGAAKTIVMDPAGGDNARIDALSSVVVRVQPPAPATGADMTLRLVKTPTSAPAPKRKRKPLGPPTKRQVVRDRRGDSHGCFSLDIVKATATRKRRAVVFEIFNAAPMTQHDGFGNAITPGLELPRARGHASQVGSDGSLRGYRMRYWPKVAHRLTATTISWTIPLKFLPKPTFRWRAECLEGYHVRDAAPDKGYKTFVR